MSHLGKFLDFQSDLADSNTKLICASEPQKGWNCHQWETDTQICNVKYASSQTKHSTFTC